MATTLDQYAPFDSGPGANVTESTWRAFMRRATTTGVIVGTLNTLRPFADSTGMQVKIDTGECWIEGHWGQNSAIKALPIAAAHATLARKDRAIARCDFVNNRIELDVLTGLAAASPVLPSLTQTTSIWEISLGGVDVPATDTNIDAGQVTDLRNWGFPPDFQPIPDTQNTAGTTSSTTFTATLASGTACGVAFTAPPSGTVTIHNTCAKFNSGAFYTYCSYQVRLGATIGSGTVIQAVSDNESIYHTGIDHIRDTVTTSIAGLTPGTVYNVQQLFRVNGGTGTYNDKKLSVQPLT